MPVNPARALLNSGVPAPAIKTPLAPGYGGVSVGMATGRPVGPPVPVRPPPAPVAAPALPDYSREDQLRREGYAREDRTPDYSREDSRREQDNVRADALRRERDAREDALRREAQGREDRPVDMEALKVLMATARGPQVAAPTAVDDRGASDAAFARAKDKTGLLALRRMADSRGRAAQMGLTGGGAEIGAADSVLGDASSGLQDFALGQAQTEASRGYAVNDRNYAGALQQRGQDMSLTPTLLSLYRAGRAY